MKLANRIGAAVLATAMVGTLLTGCGGGSASTTASTGDGTAAASSTESSGDGDNTYTMFMRSTYVDWIKELKWYDVAEERTGIHVDYISGPEEFNDVYSEIDQRVISGDLPDAVMTKLAQTNVYGPQGVFADLAPYIEKYAPNLQKYIDDNPDYKALVTDKDGHIYGLCKETPIFADLIGYRVDQFKAAGIDPDSIVTIDDFTKALETLKAYYGKDNPNYYPLTGRDTAIRFASWFGAASNTLMPLENVQGGDMPGDTAHISTPVCRRVEKLLPHLVTKLEEKYGTDIPAKLVIAVSGGSGSGKTSGAAALREALAMVGLKGYVLSGDNYPRRIPQHNDEERLTIFRSAGLKALLAAGEYTPERFADLQPLQKTGIDSDPRQCAAYPWMQIYQQGGRAALAGYLGRTAEQDYDALNAVLAQFRAGAPVLWLKRMGRKEWERWYEPKNFADVDVLLLEWTHAGSADLKNTNLKVFFNSTPEETRACRVARSRDAGADSPFVTMVLEIEQAMLNRRACDADLIQNRDGTMVDTAAYAAAQGR